MCIFVALTAPPVFFQSYRNQQTYNNCNLGHNILELYNVLIQTRLASSKSKRDI